MMWWSGAFALAALAHLLRAVSRVPVVVGSLSIPLWVSWLIAPLAGFASSGLVRRALEKQAGVFAQPPLPCLGGCHPKSMEHVRTTPEREPGVRAYGGLSVSHDAIGEDDEAQSPIRARVV